MAMFSDMGINVVDEDEVEEAEPDTPEEESTELAERTGTAVASKSNTREGSDRTDDPVRMYLREMGSVELLSAARAKSPSPSASRPAARR
jgi:RNA polymerase primary sigma factor